MNPLDQLRTRIGLTDNSRDSFLESCLASAQCVVMQYTDWQSLSDIIMPAVYETAAYLYRCGKAALPYQLSKLVRHMPTELLTLLNAFRVIRVAELEAAQSATLVTEDECYAP